MELELQILYDKQLRYFSARRLQIKNESYIRRFAAINSKDVEN